MKIRLTDTASRDLQAIYEYLSAESPAARLRFEARLSTVLRGARDYPLTGRPTNKPMTRMKNTHPYPYLVFYRIKPSEILVLRVRHGARNPRSMPARPQ